jgi:hypothetical protein
MSLVVGFNGDYFQVWCCDGLMIQRHGDSFAPSHYMTKKIHRLPNINALCGWVGEKYDADLILKQMCAFPTDSIEKLLKHASDECWRINQLSNSFSRRNDHFFCPTGLLLGGYLMGERFLAAITPDRCVQLKMRFAAIGAGANIAAKCLSEVSSHLLSPGDAFAVSVGSIVQASHESEFVGGYIFRFFLTREILVELPIVKLGNR